MSDKSAISQEQFEEIERYLLGEMNPEERVQFERKLGADAKLQDELLIQQKLQAAIELDAWRESLDKGAKTRSLRPIWKYGIAASIIVILGFALWIGFQKSTPDSSDLYAAYFYPDPGLPIPMSSTDTYQFDEGMVSYKEEKYEDALDLWKQLLENTPTDTVLYYSAMAELNLGNAKLAAQKLEQLIAIPSGEFYYKSLWYRSLIYLQEGDLKNAQALLQQLPADNSRRNELLAKIQEQLKASE